MNRFRDDCTSGQDALISPHQFEDLTQLLLSAQEEERERIAADLHDEIGQCLSAVQFAFGGLRKQLEDRLTDGEKEVCAGLARRVSQAIEDVRHICMGLRPPMLDDLGIVSAIEWYCNELRQILTNLTIIQTLQANEDAIAPGVKIAIFRIAQEACSNACKHSGANRLSVRLESDAEGTKLEVTDDGVGFDPASVRRVRKGLGLTSMRERAVMTGGRLTICSQVGRGTRVCAAWGPR